MDYPLPEDEPTPMDEDDCEEGNSEDDMPNDLDNVNWAGYFELSDIAAGQTDAEPTPDGTATTTNQTDNEQKALKFKRFCSTQIRDNSSKWDCSKSLPWKKSKLLNDKIKEMGISKSQAAAWW